MSGGWSISAKRASTASLMDLYRLLKGSEEHRTKALEIQKELVRRAMAGGRTTREVVNTLVAGAGKRERAEIAREWAEALGVTEAEFRRLAGS